MSELVDTLSTIIGLLDELRDYIANGVYDKAKELITRKMLPNVRALSILAAAAQRTDVVEAANTTSDELTILQVKVDQRCKPDRAECFTAVQKIKNRIFTYQVLLMGRSFPRWRMNCLAIITGVVAAEYEHSGESFVGALLDIPPDQRLVRVNNPQKGLSITLHAETWAITDAIKKNVNLGDCSMYITNLPCWLEMDVELLRNPGRVVGNIVRCSDTDFEGKTVEWVNNPPLAEGSHDYVYYPLPDRSIHINIREIFEKPTSSTVYWYVNGLWIPREIRNYSTVDGKEKVNIKSGCAVTIASFKLKEVHYMFPEEKYLEGLGWMQTVRGLKMSPIKDKRLSEIAEAGKKRNLRKMQREFALLASELNMPGDNLIGYLKKRFGISAEILLTES